MLEANILTIFLCVIAGMLIILLLFLNINLLTFPRLRPTSLEKDDGQTLPFLSILVPARNEEVNIAACVRSLVAQRYERLEVLVLDDLSKDATANIVTQLIDELPLSQKGRLRLLHGTDLPPGWVGKNFACHQLAQHAQGDYLLFTDADTVHDSEAAVAILACMKRLSVPFLTAQPEYLFGSLGERLILPTLNFMNMTSLPVPLVNSAKNPALVTGNGQLLCFERAAYAVIGGHVAVKGCILEDVRLAHAIKSVGYRMHFVDAQALIHCRMYQSLAEVWRGYSKNFFAFYNYSLSAVVVGLLLSLVLYIIPLLLLLSSLFVALPPSVLLLAIGNYVLTVLMRVCVTLRFEHRQRALMLLLCIIHPVSILLGNLLLLNAICCHYRRKGTEWKGRYYDGRVAAKTMHHESRYGKS
jgi:chlorobactene glucosyltransferase